MPRLKYSTFVLLWLLLLPALCSAQVRISSPYTRYGAGELQTNRFSTNMGMGGLSYALHSKSMVNPENPASYSAFDTTSFLCEAGLASQFSSLTTATSSQGYTGNATLGYLLFGFPVTKWWHASLGMIPFSKTGYKVMSDDTLSPTGRIVQEYEGSGGINRAYVGSSFRLFKGFSAGINLSFLFGSTSRSRSVEFPDLSYSYNFRMKSVTIVNDIYLNYGIQYEIPLKKGLLLTAGVAGSHQTSVKGKYTLTGERYTTSSTGDDYIKDTVEYTEDESGSMVLPLMLGGGVAISRPGIWLASADIGWGNWKNFDYFGQADSSENTLRLCAGGEFTPKHSSVSKYWKKITYTAGLRYNRPDIVLHGRRIDEYAVSAGFNFPLPKTRSSISIAAEYGTYGTTADNLIRENFFRVTLGFKFREKWFDRRKLD